jgi:LPXTG-site transpeptidase (sortase) family protein
MRIYSRHLKQILLVIILVQLAVIAYGITYKSIHKISTPLAPATNQTQKAVKRTTVNAGLPVRLKIPKISVDASLEHVGLTPSGDMESPKNPANAAWYNQGPRPGDSGNAVIDGHFGYKNHIPAVFDNLYSLKPGDSIYVEDEKGITTAFFVRESRSFKPNQDATDVFRPSDGQEHLNLISCHGAWDQTRKSYTTRLVIFADKKITASD